MHRAHKFVSARAREERGRRPGRDAGLRACAYAMAVAALCAPIDVAHAQLHAAPAHAARVARVAERVVARGFNPLGPFAALSEARVARPRSLADSIVLLARAQVGVRYRLGGVDPRRGFDCSGLVQYVMQALAVDVPRTARLQSARGMAVDRDTAALRPGDLLTFGTRGRVSHIGIYVGDGRYVHASSVAGRVIESPVRRPPARRIKPWVGVRRVLAEADETPAATAPTSSSGS